MCMRFDAPVQAMQLSGKSQFPYMVDPNTGTSMLESDNIINYLWQVGSPLQHMLSEPVLFRQGRPYHLQQCVGQVGLVHQPSGGCNGLPPSCRAVLCGIMSAQPCRYTGSSAISHVVKSPVTGVSALPGSSTARITATFLNRRTVLGASLGQAQVSEMAFRKSFCQTTAGAFLFCLRLPLRCLLLGALMTDATSVVPCRSMAMGRFLCR